MSTRDESSPSPFVPEPAGPTDRASAEQSAPRLGIMHLMVWAACVAVYFSASRALVALVSAGSFATQEYGSPQLAALFTGQGALQGVGAGAALGGLVMLAARRWRGLTFPAHPGEYLWVLLGFAVVLQFLQIAAYGVLFARRSIATLQYVGFAVPLLSAVIWVWAIVKVRERRWRAFLVALAAAHVVAQALVVVLMRFTPPQALAGSGAAALVYGVNLLPRAVDLALIPLVLIEHLQGRRRPWTHWTGVALRLWFVGLAVLSWVLVVNTN